MYITYINHYDNLTDDYNDTLSKKIIVQTMTIILR